MPSHAAAEIFSEVFTSASRMRRGKRIWVAGELTETKASPSAHRVHETRAEKWVMRYRVLVLAYSFQLVEWQPNRGSAVRSGSRGWCAKRMVLLHASLLIATFGCAAPARCGAVADERRVVVDDVGGRVRTRSS